MQWAHRVKPEQISHIYDLAKLGIYDDELLLEVGWGLYARCQSVLTVTNAVNKGELPCPQCDQVVYRPVKHTIYLERKAKAITHTEPRFPCPVCKQELKWRDCQEALRNHPKCFIRVSNSLWTCPTRRISSGAIAVDGSGCDWSMNGQ